MRRPTVLAIALSILALTLGAPAAATSDVHARNVAFLRAMIAEEDLAQSTTLPDGRSVPLAAALDILAKRAGSTDLAALAQAQTVTGVPALGDVWVLEYGAGPCVIEASPFPLSIPSVPAHPQAWLYGGQVGTMTTSQGHYTMIIGWTTKTTALGFDTAGFSQWGLSDMFCAQWADEHIAFPFLDGYASMN